MTSRATVGGNQSRGSLRSSKYALPSNSVLIPREPPLERSEFAQTSLDILAVIFGALFICSLAVSLPLALYMLFFCEF
jgi:hypothetical protein